MIIREATRADSEWIFHHRHEMFAEGRVSEEVLDETDDMTRGYLTGDWTEDFRYFLAEIDGNIIGGCGLSIFRIPPFSGQRTGLMAYLFNMYVEPQERRKGVGNALLNHVVGLCIKEGVGLVLLHASELGRYLYSTYGFATSKSLMQLQICDKRFCFNSEM